MPSCSIEQAEAVRRYYAAFPALSKSRESPVLYYLPPPVWCPKSDSNPVKMQSELSMSKEWNIKNKKATSGKERRHTYHGHRRNNKKRHNSHSRSFETQENLPEWMTHEGVWDIETQDPVKEFIRALALDEGYGTGENTITEEIKEIALGKMRINDDLVPDWSCGLDVETEWGCERELDTVQTPVDDELYEKFKAKFDQSLEALWSTEQNTPDDEYQELPIDFQELLASPTDLHADDKFNAVTTQTSAEPADLLHTRLRPLQLADEPSGPSELDAFVLYDGDDIYDALATVADTMRSFTALNHSRDRSGFVEVPPRRRPPPVQPLATHPSPPPPPLRDEPLTAAQTHFRPIRRQPDADVVVHYADGETFPINGELEEIEYRRSPSGGEYLDGKLYLEYRTRTIDYGRLRLTAAQRCPDLEVPGLRLRFPVRQRDAAAQTERATSPTVFLEATWPDSACEHCGRAAKKMRTGANIDTIWSAAGGACGECANGDAAGAVSVATGVGCDEELSREWDELLSDISAAHAQYAAADVEEALVSADRKRRHSAALRSPAEVDAAVKGGARCSHPHARFLHCCTALDRPLTR